MERLSNEIEIGKEERANFTKNCLKEIFGCGESKYSLKYELDIIDKEKDNNISPEFKDWLINNNKDFFYSIKKKKKKSNPRLILFKSFDSIFENSSEVFFNCGDDLGNDTNLIYDFEKWIIFKEVLILIKEWFPIYYQIKTKKRQQKINKKAESYGLSCNYCYAKNSLNSLYCCKCGSRLEK